jgi:hypothetical protein
MDLKQARRPASAAVLTLLIFLGGCVKYEDHITVDKDGKGSAVVKMSRPKRDAWDKASALISKLRGVSFDERFSEAVMKKDLPAGVTLEHKQVEADERVNITATYTFDDINKFATWAQKSDSPFNNLSITRTADKLTVTRNFAPLEKEAMEEVNKHGADVTVRFSFTGPGEIEEQNASRVDGNTLVWEYDAPELFRGAGKSLHAEYFFGTSYMPYIAMGVLAFIAFDLFLIFKFIKKRQTFA